MGIIRYLGFAMFVFISCFLVLGITAAADPTLMLPKCTKYIKRFGPKIPPSKQCCAAMKMVDISCFCRNPPIKFETIFSMSRFVYAATTCACKTPPPGTKCGSYTIPAPPQLLIPNSPHPPPSPPSRRSPHPRLPTYNFINYLGIIFNRMNK
ncbi:unnamed protein product [Lathyrus oleraceus]|uniref:Bifunctional inhibitor/plant lipid transfer protein/seed storage helical domain-containing protein n=1 Tax=Pisum sativum TaxID=3888 RepID=A0A9D5AZK8_PEA|nr:uncharacterized protein LOC127126776 [Pisum sativum]KAI5428033.1 hypothetical protein KIW84_033157 [Pisum sativum]